MRAIESLQRDFGVWGDGFFDYHAAFAPFLLEDVMKLSANLGMILLAVWLILFGVLTAPMLGFHFNRSGDVLAILAIVTGIVLIVRR